MNFSLFKSNIKDKLKYVPVLDKDFLEFEGIIFDASKDKFKLIDKDRKYFLDELINIHNKILDNKNNK
jgi:hypothetical protein